jgi:hypothetical protein
MGGRSWRLLFFVILTAGIVGYQLVIAVQPTFSLLDCLFFLLAGAIASLLSTSSAHEILLRLSRLSRKPGYSLSLICLGALSALSGTPFFFLSLLIGFSLVADWLPLLLPDEAEVEIGEDMEEGVEEDEEQPRHVLSTGDIFRAMVMLVKDPISDRRCRCCQSDSLALSEHPYDRLYHKPDCKVPELYEALTPLLKKSSQSV